MSAAAAMSSALHRLAKTGLEQMDQLEDERHFDTVDVERQITSPDSNKKILEEIRKYSLEHEATCGRYPKTLVFAVNDLPHTSHADQLVDMARDIFGQGESFVQKITGRVDRPLQRIREFRNRPQPTVVVAGVSTSPDFEGVWIDGPITFTAEESSDIESMHEAGPYVTEVPAATKATDYLPPGIVPLAMLVHG